MPFSNTPPDPNAMSQPRPTAVRAASTANINVGGARAAVDGYTAIALDAILLVAQTDPKQNGVWIAHTATSTWRRPILGEIGYGAHVNGLRVTAVYGTANQGKMWTLTTVNPIVLDTTELTFTLSTSAAAASDQTLTGMVWSDTPPTPNTIT